MTAEDWIEAKESISKENQNYHYHRSILNDEFWRLVAVRIGNKAVEDYKEKLKENVAVFRKIAAENKMQTGAGTLSSSHFNGRIGMCGEILKLIDSIK